MARRKNQSTFINRRLTAVFSVLISICLTLIVLHWLNKNIGNSDLFNLKISVSNAAGSFRKVEAEYNKIVLDIFATRTAIPNENINQLEEQYKTVQREYTSIVRKSTFQGVPANLLDTVETRLQNIQALRKVNSLLLIEEQIGTSFSSYLTCKERINYTKRPNWILEQLIICKKDLNAAMALVPNLPPESTSDCSSQAQPKAIFDAFEKNHEILVAFYQLSAKNKATASVAVELAYQNSLHELQKKPSWNYCLTRYLEAEGQLLLQ
ncbi:hypothetical protein COZ14_00260 [Candidatus Dojkabacteria bacterium CG_4_10_14_3_um_filter_Dojkabacteria_WS6_41_9]|uniref:Uncharacterized protein n=1 Tax=Candidatus Dojkabacteria bacterium CG_4_10_14_0_2_um_filter_Dojkabacteria_WS6_41_15 TaxID=2014249 RepID=A0A2M7W0V9_9BACT|nr:MAG: hypothetical protein COZ14_00260 [Candidatus Dojkabacteria bacterium CG_4_10_14_3_um_filter_Dojkabacteria_WS6_41_9]PJA12267.1 MAG: hypothetical protein COX64_04845 [Candidatus Dojkabacteria bacterium CG_4_10_14_0_2_um_filter_Dojkabacteria_WS6_41_15]